MARKGKADQVKRLLSLGANAKAPPLDGLVDDRTPLLAAVQKGHAACVEILLDHGVDVNQTTTSTNGKT